MNTVRDPDRQPDPALDGLLDRRRGSEVVPPEPIGTVGADLLAAVHHLLRRDEPLSLAEVGDHTDVVAELADALAALGDRLGRELGHLDPTGTAAGAAPAELAGAGSDLAAASARARRCAELLYRWHVAGGPIAPAPEQAGAA